MRFPFPAFSAPPPFTSTDTGYHIVLPALQMETHVPYPLVSLAKIFPPPPLISRTGPARLNIPISTVLKVMKCTHVHPICYYALSSVLLLYERIPLTT